MKRLLLLLILIPTLCSVVGQSEGSQGRGEPQLIESICYGSGDDIVSADELPKVKSLIDKALADKAMLLYLVGYDDGSRGSEIGEHLARGRAAILVEYIKSYNVGKEQIRYEGGGVDSSKGCRVDIFQVFVDSASLSVVVPNVVVESGEVASVDKWVVSGEQVIVESEVDDYILSKPMFAIRTNILYWFGGVINFGGEFRAAKSNWGVLLNGGYSPLGGADWDRSFGVWFVAPELRYYFPRNPKWFMGVKLICGEYNCKLTDIGYQGAIYGGGVTTGYRMSINHRIDIEFSLGVGYAYLDYDTYYNNGSINIVEQWGISKGAAVPIDAGVNLIWKLGN